METTGKLGVGAGIGGGCHRQATSFGDGGAARLAWEILVGYDCERVAELDAGDVKEFYEG